MFAASKTSTPSGGGSDPQFNYVTMLLHGDGTNGAQNNTFVDSSTNNFTITRNGNTTQGSFSPYGSNWSANLPATVLSGLQFDRLGTTSSFNFMHNASALWTLELWVNISALPASSFPIFSNNDTTSSGIGVTVLINSSGQVLLFITNGSSGNPVCSNTFTTTAISTNSWTHIALVYNQSLASSNANLYINGVASGSANKTGNSPSASNASLAAELFSYATGGASYAFNGYASNLRITNSAVYSSAFTPSTTPLTAIANTQLLTFQSNRFVDNSTNAYAIVPRTTQSIQRFNPFGTSTAYSTSVIGGSGYFDGSGDYLTLASGSTFSPSGNYLTVEAWVYATGASGDRTVFSRIQDGSPYSGYDLRVDGGTAVSIDAGGQTTISSISCVANTWNYVVWQFDASGNRQIYVNGVRGANVTGASTSVDFNNTPRIGAGVSNGSNWAGYISNLRIIKQATAYYTGTTITVPTAPFTAVTNTALLTNFTNGAIFDNAMMNDLETVGNAQISTSVVKYGTGSLAFDGTGDWLYSPDTLTPAFTTGDFTVEFWINPTNWSATYAGVVCGILTNSLWIGKNASNFVLRAANNTDLVSYGTMPTTGTWTHVAITRSGTTARMFYDGTQVASATTSHNFVASAFYVGQDGGSNALTGYIDDLRITKGYARYTTTFTPPTAAFPNTGPL